MLDQGNPRGGFRWQNWSESGSACDYPRATLAFSHTFSTRGWGMPWGRIGNPLEGGSARVRLGSKRRASLERPIPYGPRADARVWTPCLSVIGSRQFDRSEVESQNEVPTMTPAGPDVSRTPRVRTEEVRIASVRVPDFGRNANLGRTHLEAASNHGARGEVVDRLIRVRGRSDPGPG